MNSRNNKTYALCIRCKILPSHGKTCLELYASNYSATIWSENPSFSVPFSLKMANEISGHFCRVRRVDCVVKSYPPVPDSDAINIIGCSHD